MNTPFRQSGFIGRFVVAGVAAMLLISGPELITPAAAAGPSAVTSVQAGGEYTAVSAGSRRAGRKVLLARKRIIARKGGTVKARNGAALKVPAKVMRRNGYTSIWRLPNGHLDYRISVPWRGKVRVTVPRSKKSGVVMHEVGGAWTIESRKSGQNTVWVDHLSPFRWITCFKKLLDHKKILECLLQQGIKVVSREVAEKLADLSGICFPPNLLMVPISLLFDPNCIGKLDSGEYVYPETPAPAPQPSFVEPDFPVMNTSEQPPDGVWFRNSPSTGDTPRITGHGVYAGDTVHVYCYAMGESVGSYGNRVWYYVANATRPAVPGTGGSNIGWINTHYVNDGMTANNPYPGVRPC